MNLRRYLLFMSLGLVGVNAMTLDNVISKTLEKSDELKAITQNNEAYRLYVDEQKASYYPTLDLQAYVEKKKETSKREGQAETKEDKDGHFVQVNLEQVLFEGGARGARIDEQKFKFNSNKFANLNKAEQVVQNVINSYLDLNKYNELIKLSEVNLKIQDDYLHTAVENENISGSSLERMQVESKISYANSKMYQQKNFKQSALSKLEKHLGEEITTTYCRPVINENLIPTTLLEAQKNAILNNSELKEQIESVKAQKAIIEQEKAKFKPRVVAKVRQELDDGLDVKDTRKNETSGRVELNYNLFNGFKDKSTLQREKAFLKESKSVLLGLEKTIKDNVKTSFNGYKNAKERIEYLKTYVSKNQEILKIYTEQFEGGTRSFIDILNHENEIYRSKQELIEEEYNLYLNYYTLLLNFSNLTNSILDNKQNMCKAFTVEYKSRKLSVQSKENEEELNSLLEDDSSSLNDEAFETTGDVEKEVQKKIDNSKEIKSMLDNIMNEIYTNEKQIVVDEPQKEKIKLKIKKKKQEEQFKEISFDDKVNKNDIPVTYATIEDEFKKQNSNKYTIAIAAIKASDEEVKKFLNRFDLHKNVYTFRVGDERQFVRILYGAFSSEEEAQEYMLKLHPKLLANQPYISMIKNQQDAYNTYNN